MSDNNQAAGSEEGRSKFMKILGIIIAIIIVLAIIFFTVMWIKKRKNDDPTSGSIGSESKATTTKETTSEKLERGGEGSNKASLSGTSKREFASSMAN